jgi:hypothetical protein
MLYDIGISQDLCYKYFSISTVRGSNYVEVKQQKNKHSFLPCTALIDWVFKSETECVYCTERTKSLITSD